MAVPANKAEIDEDELVRAYFAGRSFKELGKRYGVTGTTIKSRLAAHGVQLKDETLDAGPFREVLLRDLERHAALYLDSDRRQRGFNGLSVKCGVDASTLSCIANAVRPTVSLHTVDTYCCRMGHLLQDLYPSLYAFEGIESP